MSQPKVTIDNIIPWLVKQIKDIWCAVTNLQNSSIGDTRGGAYITILVSDNPDPTQTIITRNGTIIPGQYLSGGELTIPYLNGKWIVSPLIVGNTPRQDIATGLTGAFPGPWFDGTLVSIEYEETGL